ncbi:MAG: MOSC domain-containing protein [Betaproteobacteria bacterium]|nr:MOSC domain-containing protein [Betaproteobacteria bacterium]
MRRDATRRIDGLFAGGITLIGTAQQRTGIVKQPRERQRGGGGCRRRTRPTAASTAGPTRRCTTFRPTTASGSPGSFRRSRRGSRRSLGENLSTLGWTDDDVAIGDVCNAGASRSEVTQPRSPCWKIGDRGLGEPGAARWIAGKAITGWYCRVLAAGKLRVGDELVVVGRPAVPVTVAAFWRTVRRTRPRVADLERLAAIPGLATDWRRPDRRTPGVARGQSWRQFDKMNQQRLLPY